LTNGLVANLSEGETTQHTLAFSRFVNILKSEEARGQIILIVDGPATGETETLSQPQHRFEARDRSARDVERLEAADPWHVLLHSEVVALDVLLEVLGDIMYRVWMQEPVIDGRLDRWGKVLAPSVPIFLGDSNGSSFSILRKKRLAASRSHFAVSRKSIGFPCLSMARYR
jgi:hypothetical protein